ncbi:MAG: metal ABC transporter permease [Solirubrobacterales bacterium]
MSAEATATAALGLLGPITEPFQSEFIRTGAAASIIVGVLCGAVGVLVVVRGMALLADSYAHGVLPGVAIAVLLTTANADPSQIAVLAGGLAGGLVTAAGTTLILRRSGLKEDTAAAVMFVFMLALGVVLISRVSNFAVDLTAFLFGDVLSVDASELPLTAALAAAVLAAFGLLYRPIVLVSFDRRRAAAAGLRVDRVELAMMILLAFAVVIGFRVVGALLVLGLLIAPPAAAAMVTRRLPSMIAVSALIAAVSGPLGLLLSWHLEVAAGASIVLVAVGISLLLIALRPRGSLA